MDKKRGRIELLQRLDRTLAAAGVDRPVLEDTIDDVFCTIHRLHEEPLYALRGENAWYQREYDRLTAERSGLGDRVAELAAELGKAREREDALRGETRGLEGEIGALRGELDLLKARAASRSWLFGQLLAAWRRKLRREGRG